MLRAINPRKALFAAFSCAAAAWTGLPAAEWALAAFGRYEPPVAYAPGQHERIENLEFTYEWTANSQGLRSPEIPLEKPSGEIRVFMAGDSYLAADGVAPRYGVSRILEAHSLGRAPMRFVNGGLTGTGPAHYRRMLLERGFRYHPDAVLVLMYANDLSDTEPWTWKQILKEAYPRLRTLARSCVLRAREQRAAREGWDAVVAAEARAKGIPEGRIRAWRSSLPENLKRAADAGRFNLTILGYGLLRPEYWSDSLDVPDARVENRWRAMTSHYEAMRSECLRRGIRFGIVFAPTPLQYDRDYQFVWAVTGTQVSERWLEGPAVLERRLARWTEERGIPFLDLSPAFRASKRKSRLHFRYDGHWTREGHALAASRIAQWLSGPANMDLPVPGNRIVERRSTL